MAPEKEDRSQFTPARQTVRLTEAESWELLAGASLGRIVFTERAMPAIRPVNHLVDDRTIIIRSHLGSALTSRASGGGTVVCYEADDLDAVRHTGWSVVATGMASLVTDPDAVEHYERVLHPWVDGQMNYVIAVRPQIITGIRLMGWCRLPGRGLACCSRGACPPAANV